MVSIGSAHVVPDKFIALRDIGAGCCTRPAVKVSVGSIDLAGHCRPHRRNVLAENYILNAIVASCILLAIHIDAAGAAVDIEYQGIADQLVVHYKDRTAISRNGRTGGSIEIGIVFIAVLAESRRGRRIDCRSNLSRSGATVIINERRRSGGVVILLDHVNDSVVDRIAGPVCVERGVFVYRHRAGHTLGQLRIGIPAFECITVPGRIRSGEGNGRTVRNGLAGNVTAAVGLKGELEVLAGVIDVQFLLRLSVLAGSRNSSTLGQFQNSIVKGLNGGRHVAVQNTLNIRSPVDLRVAVAVQVFQQVYEVIHRRESNVLDADRGFEFAVKVAFFHRNSRRFRIIDRGAGDLVRIGLSGGRSSDGVGQVIRLGLQQVGVEDDFLSVIVQVIILRGDVVYRDCAELGHSGDVAVYDCFGSHFLAGFLVDPLLKYFAGDKRILRHGADRFAYSAEILGQRLNDRRAVVAKNDKPHEVFVFKLSRQCEIGSNGLAADVLGIAPVPAVKFLAFHNGSGGQYKRVSLVVGFRLIDVVLVASARYLVGNSKHILFILDPHVSVGGNMHVVVKIAAGIYPLAGVPVLHRNSGNAVHTVRGVGFDDSGSDYLCFSVICIEGDRVTDLIVIRNDYGIFRGNVGGVDPAAGDLDLVSLSIGDDLAFSPVCRMVVTGDHSRKVTDR